MRWGKQDPYLFLMILRRNEAPMEFENGYTECLGRRQLREKMNSHKSSRENWKGFKNCPYLPNTRFSWLKWVATKSPGQAAKILKDIILEKISKCFSRLEGLPVRESWAEPWKSLSNPHDRTFHSRTSRQKMIREHATEARDLTNPRLSRQKQGKTEFLKISNFENKILSKNT